MTEDMKKTAGWAPGTLDKTRKNIGDLSRNEAAEMAKKLGGEVMYERSTANPSGASSSNSGNKNGRIIRSQPSSSSSSSSSSSTSSSSSSSGTGVATASQSSKRRREDLPEMNKKSLNAINKLMMSIDYKIKPNYGIFNFILSFKKNGQEKILPVYFSHTLKNHIGNMENFITIVKTLIQMSPATYKTKIVHENDSKFKFLRMVAGWSMVPIKSEYNALENIREPLVVADLIPFIRALYKPLITVYYYGDTKIPKLLKEIYADECAYPDAPKDKLSDMAKQAITQWLYIDNEIIKKTYPLLMRMCSDSFYSCDDFFRAKIAEILKFTELHKFDLLLPEKPKETEEEKKKKEEKPQPPQKGVKDSTVLTGIKLLDQFFPDAGFNNLDIFPDLYPYFQPLYKFDEGFNMLAPDNPMMTVIVLLRIVEDCCHGLRNVKFIVPDSAKQDSETITDILDDWSAYREDVFLRLYCEPLKNLVNSTYSQKDFSESQLGKKLVNSILWQTQYNFLPIFKFNAPLLERPSNESKFKPLFHRTDFARKYLTLVVNECDKAAKNRVPVSYVENPWSHYEFDIQNEVSKRLDVLLGGQNRGPNTNATNANLVKYTLCFISVLDWWLNNPDSPAYKANPDHIYRISPADGKPMFSVPERGDQNKLFADAVKSAFTKK